MIEFNPDNLPEIHQYAHPSSEDVAQHQFYVYTNDSREHMIDDRVTSVEDLMDRAYASWALAVELSKRQTAHVLQIKSAARILRSKLGETRITEVQAYKAVEALWKSGLLAAGQDSQRVELIREELTRWDVPNHSALARAISAIVSEKISEENDD